MKILIKLYAKDTIISREVEAAVSAAERIIGEALCFLISENGNPVKITNRLYLLNDIDNMPENKRFPLLTNANKKEFVSLKGVFLAENGLSHANIPMWYLILKIRKEIIHSVLIRTFNTLCDFIPCYNGKITLGFPIKTESRFFDQSQPDYTPSSIRDLPKLLPPKGFDNPYLPADLGWLNYWPAPALKRINFQEQHRALFHSVQPAANDGLILQITEEPLDLDNAEHLRKTVAIYDALPAIGGRDCA